jgi:hypothetical protein
MWLLGNDPLPVDKKIPSSVLPNHNHISTSHEPTRAYQFSILSSTDTTKTSNIQTIAKEQKTNPHFDSDMSSSVLADRDVNTERVGANGAAQEVKADVKSMEYHRQVLQSKLDEGK